MKSISITETFTGYPENFPDDPPRTAPGRLFEVGATIDDLPDAYADLLIEKGLATLSGGGAKPARSAFTLAPASPEPTA